MANLIKPDASIKDHWQRGDVHHKALFLAGTIDMGESRDWQTDVYSALKHMNVDIYNPRRDSWDSSWTQTAGNTQFTNQVLWEQKHIMNSEIVLFNFEPNSKSPISHMELGQFCNDGPRTQHIVVCAPKNYYRIGNIEVMCILYNIPLYEKLEDAIIHVKVLLKN